MAWIITPDDGLKHEDELKEPDDGPELKEWTCLWCGAIFRIPFGATPDCPECDAA